VDRPEYDEADVVLPGEPVSTGGLLGRAAELRSVDELLAAVWSGRSAALVLVGEPGIGKTSLLRYAARAAGDIRALEVVGAESEQHMG
jgi:predicted ATP-dependent serine protease